MGGSMVSLFSSMPPLEEESRRWIQREGIIPMHSSIFTNFEEITPSCSYYTIKDKIQHYKNTTRNTQVTIEPRVPNTTTVGLNSQLTISIGGNLGDGLQTKIRRISMRGNNRKSISLLELASYGDSHNSRLISGKIVLSHRLHRFTPGCLLAYALKSARRQTFATFLHNMEVANPSSQKLDKRLSRFQKFTFHWDWKILCHSILQNEYYSRNTSSWIFCRLWTTWKSNYLRKKWDVI